MAKRTMSLLAQWSSRVFSIDLDKRGALLNFALAEKPQQAPETFRNIQERCYSVLVCGEDRIRSARFYWGLEGLLRTELPAECELLPVSSHLPHVKDSLIRGYFLKDASECPSLTRRVLGALGEQVQVCSYLRGADGGQWAQQLWSGEPENQSVSKTFYVVPSEEANYHPSVLNMENSDVFYCRAEACKVLQEVCPSVLIDSLTVDLLT